VKGALVGDERREVVEEPPVASALDRGVDSFRSEAVISGDRLRAHE
jgi:hypothetical protein